MKRIASITLTLILALIAIVPAAANTPIAPANDQCIRPDIKPEKMLVLDFTASWCGPCRLMTPAVEKAAEFFGNTVTFMTIDVDKYPETAAAFDITVVPTIIMIPVNGEGLRSVGLKGYFSEIGENATYNEKVEAIYDSLIIQVQILEAITGY